MMSIPLVRLDREGMESHVIHGYRASLLVLARLTFDIFGDLPDSSPVVFKQHTSRTPRVLLSFCRVLYEDDWGRVRGSAAYKVRVKGL